MMYETLIKTLKKSSMDFGESDTISLLLFEAANAIEELQKAVMKLEDESGIYDEFPTIYIYPAKWISVTDKENLPNTDSGVVGYFGGGAFDQLRWYDFVTTLSDGTIVGENTERDVMNEHCIAVYKLPEPPKDGE